MRTLAVVLVLITLVGAAAGETPEATVLSPRGTFRIDRAEAEAPIWLVSTRDPARRARLPEIRLSDVERGATSSNIGYGSELSISPDERYILRDQKLYHGANALYLYRRAGGLSYRPAAQPRLDRVVKRFFARQVGGRERDELGIVEFVSWSDDGKSVILSLRGRDVAGYDVVGWQCTIELAGSRVRLTEAQTKSNEGTFTKSKVQQ